MTRTTNQKKLRIRSRLALLVLAASPARAAGASFNIRDYGAKNDGSSPATEAFRAALPFGAGLRGVHRLFIYYPA